MTKTPNFASGNHGGVGRVASDSQVAPYFLPAAGLSKPTGVLLQASGLRACVGCCLFLGNSDKGQTSVCEAKADVSAPLIKTTSSCGHTSESLDDVSPFERSLRTTIARWRSA